MELLVYNNIGEATQGFVGLLIIVLFIFIAGLLAVVWVNDLFAKPKKEKEVIRESIMDVNNLSIPLQYRALYITLSPEERDEFLNALWIDIENGQPYTQTWDLNIKKIKNKVC